MPKILSLIMLLGLFSCGARGYEEQYLYDRSGFKSSSPPPVVKVKGHYNMTKTATGYRRTSPPTPPTIGNARSRFYSNPYELSPGNNQQNTSGYPVYGADRYYVPPSSYRYIENSN